MTDFVITVNRMRNETCEVSVTAEDEDAAGDAVIQMTQQLGWASKQGWNLDEETFEILEVNEE